MNTKKQNCALILIDVQKGFFDASYWGPTNNPDIEKNISELLATCRESQYPIIHVQHLSTDKASPLRPEQAGSKFIESCTPRMGESIFQKSVNSAFIGTNLEAHLRSHNIDSVVLVGFTSDHCVSTTARMAANLGFRTFIIANCTATFDRQGLDTSFPAELVHQVSLASLHHEFATVFRTTDDFKASQLIKTS